MKIVADFHLHSRYSMATSSQLDLDQLSRSARLKGIHLLGTGDCTHPLWMQELKTKLKPTPGGLYQYQGAHFLLTAEVNNLFVVDGRAHRIHNLLLVPSIETAELLNKQLAKYGELSSDGRPSLRLSPEELVKLALNISPEIVVVPAHAWTPHFSVFGANSGFDTIEECFGSQAKEIFCLETGLSSDPGMNGRLSRLDRFTLISNSDSHSAGRIGREANVFDAKLSYAEIISILRNPTPEKFLYTIEFFPEEGKYHYDGHRACKVRYSPEESKQAQNRCPVCGKKVTVGVLHRISDLADRPENFQNPRGIPFKHLVPLDQIIAESKGVGVNTKGVEREYLDLTQRVGTELEILMEIPEEILKKHLSPKLLEGVFKVRGNQVQILPGYDGEYGKVSLFSEVEALTAAS